MEGTISLKLLGEKLLWNLNQAQSEPKKTQSSQRSETDLCITT